MPMLFADVAGVHVEQSFWSKLMSLEFTIVVEEQSVETPAVARTRRCTVQLLKTCWRFTVLCKNYYYWLLSMRLWSFNEKRG
jgi:hypothetical protein